MAGFKHKFSLIFGEPDGDYTFSYPMARMPITLGPDGDKIGEALFNKEGKKLIADLYFESETTIELIKISALRLFVSAKQTYDNISEVQSIHLTDESGVYINSTSSEPVHGWFELSYAQYLTIPRSVLQSMPMDWQERFVRCLDELDELIDWRPKQGCYWVKLKNDNGQFVKDGFADYQRGRRQLPYKTPIEEPAGTIDNVNTSHGE